MQTSQASVEEIQPVDLPFNRPTFAAVIPVYKHAVLLTEALSDMLRECKRSHGHIIIVNDGCPLQETDEICEAYARANPTLISYIKTPNRGLPAARNHGIRYALARFVSLESLYLMDADNRLLSGGIERAQDLLDRCGCDWVYPDIIKFGIRDNVHFGAPYSAYRHLFQNICEAGSLIHRRVFDAGVFYDESMRDGYEDWEFWLQCIEAGFKGIPCANFGFRYRARSESMLSNSNRMAESLKSRIKLKHRSLYSSKSVLALEHTDCPRFCTVESSLHLFNFTSIAGGSSYRAGLPELQRVLWANIKRPYSHYFPGTIVFINRIAQQGLEYNGLLDWVFWTVESELASSNFVGVILVSGQGEIQVSRRLAETGTDLCDLHILATSTRCLSECIQDKATDWIDTLKGESGLAPMVTIVTVFANFDMANSRLPKRAVNDLLKLVYQVRSSPWKIVKALDPQWKRAGEEAPLSNLSLNSRTLLNAFAPIASGSDKADNIISFIVPVFSFGGVEQVCQDVARIFKAEGWVTRLVITSQASVLAAERIRGVFDSIFFLENAASDGWVHSADKYFGQNMPSLERSGGFDRLLGLLAGSDAVINFHSLAANEVMAAMKRSGAATVTSLHVFDQDRYGAPQGHPYSTLAFEHAYDLVTTCSLKLAEILHALGVPRKKLLLLRNAPTFTPTEVTLARRLGQLKLFPATSRSIRVIYVGRLDRQKGVDRLEALIVRSQELGLAVEWRLVGAAVLADTNMATRYKWEALGIDLEEPVFDRAELQERLLWADVLILPSLWEGAPIIIQEAQQLGVVPFATNVGAVSELISDGEDGVLIPNGTTDEVVESVIGRLSILMQDRARLADMANNSIARLREVTWQNNATELVNTISRIVQIKRGVPLPELGI